MRLRPLPYREVKRRLQAPGFTYEGQKGSHAKFSRMESSGERIGMVPTHHEIAVGTLGIIRQTAMSLEEFEKL